MATKYEEFLARSQNDERVEFTGGETVPLASPRWRHSEAQSTIISLFKGPFQWGGNFGPGGWWFFFDAEIEIDGETLRPDAFGIRVERLPPIDGELEDEVIRTRPDWVCEVISSSNAKDDLVRKMDIYRKWNIPYYWIIDPRPGSRIITVYLLDTNERWSVLGSYVEENTQAKIAPFDAIEIDVSKFFLPIPKK